MPSRLAGLALLLAALAVAPGACRPAPGMAPASADAGGGVASGPAADVGGGGQPPAARADVARARGRQEVGVGQLPREARDTLARIRAGGPFPYRQDGVVFGNREHALPPRAPGYYREYTVRTPGVDDRGARRIVAGRDGDLWYTADHYRTFRRIEE